MSRSNHSSALPAAAAATTRARRPSSGNAGTPVTTGKDSACIEADHSPAGTPVHPSLGRSTTPVRLASRGAPVHLPAMTGRDAGPPPPPPPGAPVGPIAALPESDRIDPALLRDTLVIRDWLLAVAAHAQDAGAVLSGFAEQLTALGVPVERMTTAIDTLHSEYSGIGRYWTKEEGGSYLLFPHGPESDRIYAESPFAHVHRTRDWLLMDLSRTPDD